MISETKREMGYSKFYDKARLFSTLRHLKTSKNNELIALHQNLRKSTNIRGQSQDAACHISSKPLRAAQSFF